MEQSVSKRDFLKPNEATRDDFLSLDSRRQPIDNSVDDFIVLFGLVVAGRATPESIMARLEGGVPVTRALNDVVASGRISSEDWSMLYRLWYRWKIPWGAASLAWWYLFCTALKRTSDPEKACDLCTAWIERIADADIQSRAALYSSLTDISADKGVVAVRDDVTSLDCFVTAAVCGLPLIKVWSDDELRGLADAGSNIVFSDVDPASNRALVPILLPHLPKLRQGAADLRLLCRGRHPKFSGISEEVRNTWAAMTPEDRTFLLVHLEQKLACLEIFRLSYGNIVYDNDGIAGILSECRSLEPSKWTPLQLSAATICWIWQEAGFCLQELSQAEMTMPLVRVFLERRIADYEAIKGPAVPAGLHLLDLARRFATLRAAVEQTHQRCLYFDGSNWERREFIVPKADIVRETALPAGLRSWMASRFGVAMPEGESPTATLRQYVGELIAHSYTPSDLLIALAEWAANADDMWTDYAIFTVPAGVKLDRPWDLSVDDLFCYTALRRGFEPKAVGVPLKEVGIFNAIGQRMRFNAVKKAQNYALVKHMTPQSFLLPDVSVAEDAHHNGHYASGVRHALRVPMAVTYRGSAWKGIADVRLSRAPYHESNRFRERDLTIACRYGIWSRAVADEAYARGILFDRRYCLNLDDGRNLAARLGEENAKRHAN